MRLVTRRHVLTHWSATEQDTFRRYAWPVSDEVFVLWSQHPDDWAPQNHSCAPNARYAGLDVVAVRDIAAGEELTLDYGELLNEEAEPFHCRCGAPGCRGLVTGRAGNSVTAREQLRPWPAPAPDGPDW